MKIIDNKIMQAIFNKKTVVFLLIIIISMVGFKTLYKPTAKPEQVSPEKTIEDKKSSASPEFLFTKPEGLEKDVKVILPSQTIEITFNQPIENIGEFKHKLEPKVKYQAKLSDDKKTVILNPEGSFPVGTEFTLFVQSDTKFDGKKNFEKELQLHFKTLTYRGV